MANRAFDDNVPRVRPRVRLGRSETENVTDTPPVRPTDPEAEAPVVAEAAPEIPVVAAPEPVAAEVVSVVVAPPVVEPAPAPIEAPRAAVRELVSPVVAPTPVVAPPPAPGEEAAAPITPPEPVRAPQAVAAPAVATPVAPPPAARPAILVEDDIQDRRASLRRRAVVAGSSPAAPPVQANTGAFDDLSAIEAAADLAAELERALSQAAESNENLRRDLGMALDDLARTTAENKRLQERVERLEGDSRERSTVVQDLLQEMELLEGERDTALTQASDAALSTDELSEKLVLAERRVHDAERALVDAQSRSRRFEEQVQLHLAQRTSLRAEVDGLRRERDGMVTRIAELEREHTELSRSRQALDEVHRALNEARQRAQRIRTR